MPRTKSKHNNKKKSNASTDKVIELPRAPPRDNWINPALTLGTANDMCKGRQTGPWVINEILSSCYWWQDAESKHYKWKRYFVIGGEGPLAGRVTTMTITFSSTPGDKKAWQKQKSNLLSHEYHDITAMEGGMLPIAGILSEEWNR